MKEDFAFHRAIAAATGNVRFLEFLESAGGLIDSTGILELVSFLESEFGMAIADADIIPENLDSIAAITAYVERKLRAAAAAA